MSDGESTGSRQTAAPDRVQFLRVRVGDRVHAVEAGHAAGVVEVGELTPVPHTGPAVAGAARLREEVTVLIDPHALLGTEPSTEGPMRAALLDAGPGETAVAVRVDGAEGFDRVHVDRVTPVDRTDMDPRLFAAAVAPEADGDRFGVFGADRLSGLVRTAGR